MTFKNVVTHKPVATGQYQPPPLTARDRKQLGITEPVSLPAATTSLDDLDTADHQAGKWMHKLLHELETEAGLRSA